MGKTNTQIIYKYYNLIMNFKNNGVTYRSALRKILAMSDLLLPDERLF